MFLAIVSTHINNEYNITSRFLFKVSKWHVGGVDSPVSWFVFFKLFSLGFQGVMGPCWYFCSLIGMRIMMQLIPEKRWIYAILFVLFSLIGIWMHYCGLFFQHSIINIVLTMPFFLIGIFLKNIKNYQIDNIPMQMIILIIAILVLFWSSYNNGNVWMFRGEYGNNYFLFLIGGVAGATTLYIMANWLSKIPYHNMVVWISKGSIAIIGLHIIVVRRLIDLPNRLWIEDLFFSIMILFSFVPLIRILDIYFPTLLGKHSY